MHNVTDILESVFVRCLCPFFLRHLMHRQAENSRQVNTTPDEKPIPAINPGESNSSSDFLAVFSIAGVPTI